MLKRATAIILILMLLVPGASASILDDANNWIESKITSAISGVRNEYDRDSNRIDLPLGSIISYDSSVPVQIGYNSPTKFWILTATIGWTFDELVLIKLPSGTTDSGSKAQKEVSIKIYPNGAYSNAPLTKSYADWGDTKSDIYYVEGGAWKTTTMYDIYMNQWYYIDVSYDKPAQVNLYGGAYVNNLGILPNGANIPSGDFVILIDPFKKPHIVKESSLQASINYWNNNKPAEFFYQLKSYEDIYYWLKDRGMWPSDIVLSQNANLATTVYYDCGSGKYYTECYPQYGETYKYVKVKYPMTAASSFITLNIPSTLADTILVKVAASKAVIVGTPTVTASKEREYGTLSVTVRNDGGDDYISVKPTSSFYSFTAIGDNTQFMKSGETKTFTFKAYALDVNSDSSNAKIDILADGSDPYAGDSSKTIYGTIYDNPVLPPYVPTPTPVSTQAGEQPPGQGEDMTWIFWVVIAAISLGGFLYTRNPWFLALLIIVGILYFTGIMLDKANTLADKANPFNWF